MDDFEAMALAAAAKKRRGGQGFASAQYAPNGVPMNDAAKAELAARGKSGQLSLTPTRQAEQAGIDRTGEDLMIIGANPVLARVQEFMQGTPLIGEFADEAVGMISPKAANDMRARSDAMERQYPGQSALLGIAGSVATTIPAIALGVGAKAADFVAKGASRFGQAIRGATVAAPIGAVEGAAASAGRADTGGRVDAAATGAAIGGSLGAVLGSLAPLVGEGVASLARRVKKLDVSAIAREFAISSPAARVVRRYLLADDLDAAAAVLARGGDDAMLANAGPSTRQALDTAMSTGGEALSIGRKRIDAATKEASGRLLATIDDILGGAEGGIKAASREASERTAAARKTAYDFTYSQPTPMAGEAGARLDGILARISPDDMKAAIKEANKEMLNDGRVNQNIIATIGPDGKVTYSQPLSVIHLDYIKRGLANMVDAGTDNMTGALTPAARRSKEQAKALRAELNLSVPGYSRAMKLGGDNAQVKEGLRIGRGLLSEKTSVEDVRVFLREGVADDVRASVKKGLRENIAAVMGRARTTIADMESGAMDFEAGMNATAEAVAAVRNVLTGNNMAKTRLAIGSDSKKLFSEMQKMGDALVLRAAVARGSATAIRKAGQDQMAEEVAPGLLRRTTGNLGNPFDAAREITRAAAGLDGRTITAEQQKYFAEIADSLTRIKGTEAQAALAAVKRAMESQPIKDAEAQLIGRVLSGAAAVGLYQAGTQSLRPQ